MKKSDDRITNTSNIQLSGTEVREVRKKDLARWKRRMHRSIKAQKYNMEEMNPFDEMYQIYEAENRAYDMCLSIINAKWKNV